jgi:hypothetical protein
VHNQEAQAVDTDEVVADEMGGFVQKNRSTAVLKKLSVETAGLESA